MEVILKKDVANVGRMGEVVRVKSGFGRNYLVPRALAVVASAGDKRNVEHVKRLIEKEKAKVRAESETKAGDIKKTTVSLTKKFNEHNKMFGSVTPAEVATLLSKEGLSFDRRDIELPDLNDAGTFEVKVRLPGDVFTTVQLKIVAEKVKEKKSAPKAKKAAKEDTASSEENVSNEDKVAEVSEESKAADKDASSPEAKSEEETPKES